MHAASHRVRLQPVGQQPRQLRRQRTIARNKDLIFPAPAPKVTRHRTARASSTETANTTSREVLRQVASTDTTLPNAASRGDTDSPSQTANLTATDSTPPSKAVDENTPGNIALSAFEEESGPSSATPPSAEHSAVESQAEIEGRDDSPSSAYEFKAAASSTQAQNGTQTTSASADTSRSSLPDESTDVSQSSRGTDLSLINISGPSQSEAESTSSTVATAAPPPPDAGGSYKEATEVQEPSTSEDPTAASYPPLEQIALPLEQAATLPPDPALSGVQAQDIQLPAAAAAPATDAGEAAPAGQLPVQMGPRARKLLISWADKASSLGWMHHLSGQHFLWWSNSLSLLALVLGLLGGSASLVNTEAPERWVTVTVGCINLASAAIVTIKRNYQVTELSTSHDMAAKQYMSFYRAVASEMIKRENHVDYSFFHWAENRFSHLQAESPAVPEWVATKFFTMFGEQLRYTPDIAPGLGALSIMSADGQETALHFAQKQAWWQKLSN